MNYDQAAEYWSTKDLDSVKMVPEQLKERIDEFVKAHNTCALATSDGIFVRCTPIEYLYYKDCFWMFSEGGLKFKALKNNKHVCVAVFDQFQEFGKIGGMQITGLVEMIEPWSEIYNDVVRQKGISIDTMKKFPGVMNLICVRPQEIDILNSEFHKEGYSSRQKYLFESENIGEI